jgi:hypothetical protein
MAAYRTGYSYAGASRHSAKKTLVSKVYFKHDNAKTTSFKKCHRKKAEFSWQLLAHPPSSPDLAPGPLSYLTSK